MTGAGGAALRSWSVAKKKVHKPKKANSQKPRRRPLGRGSGPVVDPEVHAHDHAAQRYLGPGAGLDHDEDPETAEEREARLALLAEVEAIPADRVAAALLANPLVAHLGEVLLSGADTDDSPVVTAPSDTPPDEQLNDDDVAVLTRWTRAALLLDDQTETDELAAEWREGGEAQLLAARAALAQHLMAVVEGASTPEDDERAASTVAWLGAGATGPAPDDLDVDAAQVALLDMERGEVVIDLVARLALTGRVDVDEVIGESTAREPVLRDVRLLAAAGLWTREGGSASTGGTVSVDPDLRGVLLDVADDLVSALHDDDHEGHDHAGHDHEGHDHHHEGS